ncbi:MAG: DUF2207 domain-containing protein [Spirochaetales bacterium]|nr:DUF2207 domain-containing protein [Spirochaetales bacterium]
MKRPILIALVLVAGAFCLFASTDYYIRNYDVEITVGNNAVHHIVETIDVFFEGPHHGIVREIPYEYSDYNGTTAKVRGLKCSEKYEYDYDNGYLVMQIGSASKYVQGDVTYVIEYDYDLGADYNEGYDEFYMNIIGTEWECRIDNATFSVSIPYVEHEGYANAEAFFDYVYENVHFTYGNYGSTNTSVKASLYREEDGSLLIEGSKGDLWSHEGLTLRIDLPEGWYQGARERWDHRGLARYANILLTVLLVALAVFLWSAYGRDSVPIVVARFEPPRGFSPLMVGYIADDTVDDKDVISMLFYWADEGLLSIAEAKGNKYTFTKLKDIEAYAVESGKNIPAFEIKLFNGFFKNCDVGDTVSFKDLQKNNFFQTIVDTKAKAGAYFSKDRSLYERKSKTFAGLLALLSIVPLATGILRICWMENIMDAAFLLIPVAIVLFLLNGIGFVNLFRKWHLRKSNVLACIVRFLPMVVALVLFFLIDMMVSDAPSLFGCAFSVIGSTAISFFAAIMSKRSEYGNRVLEETLGYREFIDKVEMDQLKMMIDQDPDFYYHVLSYAVVLGLEDKWARKFDGMIVNPPTWYTGYNAFDVYMMSRVASNMIRTLPAASVPKSSISGSAGSRVGGGGFHSSGFSGGGFGGGGGHAW